MSEIDEILKERRRRWEERIREQFSKIKHRELRVLVELYYDAQKHRISQSNRISVYRRLGLIEQERFQWYVREMKDVEERLAEEIAQAVEGEPIWREWLQHVRGVGPVMAAGLIAWIDDISRFPNVSKLWRYCGYAVVNGKAERKARGEVVGYNPRLKTHLWKVGVQMMKAGGKYYELYLEFREHYEGREDIRRMHEEMTARSSKKTVKATLAGYRKHVSTMALRRVIKLFLSHLWEEWRRVEGLPVTKPYPIAILGHSDYIGPLRDGE